MVVKSRISGNQSAGKVCSICQCAIVIGERIVDCPDCSLPFHEECWQENGGCAQYGCSSAPVVDKTETEAVNTGWNGEKTCPECGNTIKGQAVKCRFCGVRFNTREAMSREQFSNREYEGREFVSVRNKLIVFFLMSISGCFSPFAAILFGILVFGGSLWSIKYKRLSPLLKMLAKFGFGFSIFLILMFFIVVILDH